MEENNNKKSLREKILGFKQKIEKSLEEEKIEKENKIKFYKKVGYSITKLGKYPEMAKEGFKTATKYLVGIIAFFSIFLSILSSIAMDKSTKDGIAYLKENLPEIKYSDGILKSDSTEKVTLKHELIKEFTNGFVVIDTSVESEEIINQYIEDIGRVRKAVVLLKDKLILVNWTNINETREYNYQELLKQYALETSTEEYTEVTKDDVINYIQNNADSFTSYILQYFPAYIVIYFGTFIIYIGAVCLVGCLVNKILKLKLKIKEIYSMTVYAFTLPIIIYMIYLALIYFIQIKIPYFTDMFVVLAFIYLWIALFKLKRSRKV